MADFDLNVSGGAGLPEDGEPRPAEPSAAPGTLPVSESAVDSPLPETAPKPEGPFNPEAAAFSEAASVQADTTAPEVPPVQETPAPQEAAQSQETPAPQETPQAAQPDPAAWSQSAPFAGQPPYGPAPGPHGAAPTGGAAFYQTPPSFGAASSYAGPYPPPRREGYYGGYNPAVNQWQNARWQAPGYPAQGGGGLPPTGYYPGGYAPSGSGERKDGQNKKRGRPLLKALCCILAVVVVGFACLGGYVAVTGRSPFEERAQIPKPSSQDAQQSGGGGSAPDLTLHDKPFSVDNDSDPSGTLSPAEVYEKVSPSVVGVVAYLGQSVYGSQSQGSGIIISSDGYILTNAHVVSGAEKVEIVLLNGDSYTADLVGADERSDLAVLKAVGASGLVAAELGDSTQLMVGERVCAIGNPSGLELQSSLTVGYLSALNRRISAGGSGYNLTCIQTDAAINPGNSGGPLINEYGQVIGVNSVKIMDVDYEGIGFAIPITDAKPIIESLIANGRVTGRAMLGISAVAVSAVEAQKSGVPLGLWVKGFSEGADIAAKGVRVDDIITHIAGTPIYSVSGCADVLEDYAPGDTITVTVFRRSGAASSNTFDVDIVLMGS